MVHLLGTTKEKELEYALLAEEEDDDAVRFQRRRSTRKTSTLRIVFWVEAANALLFVLLYVLWHFGSWPRSHHCKSGQGCRDIATPTKILNRRTQFFSPDDRPLDFNTTKTFTVNKTDLSLVHSGQPGDGFWRNVTFDRNNGLVSLPLTYVHAQNLTPSGLPSEPGHSVFQVDVFHQLHCLERIRTDIVSAPFLYKLNPNRTEYHEYSQHVLHCVDYLRQAVMCTADMTLVSTNNDLEFDRSPARQCRDFEAVTGWVMKWKYDWDRWLNGAGE
jgi:hypothetical protein